MISKDLQTQNLLERNLSPEKRFPKTETNGFGKDFGGKCLGGNVLGGKVSVVNPTTNLDFPEIIEIMDFKGD